MSSGEVEVISTCTVRPLKQTTNSMGSLQRWELTPWDLSLLTLHYIQKGLLFQKPQMDFNSLLDHLKASLSHALDYFLPLAGRLAITTHDDEVREVEGHGHPPSISFFIDGNGAGAEFIHAAVNRTMSDILSPLYVPRVVHSFFPLKEPFNHKGCTLPLLAVQVTELVDAMFIGCSINHAVIDGTSFWHFFNSWSEICRGGNQCTSISRPPLLDRWFLNDGDGDGDGLPPIRLNVSLKFLELSTSPPPQEEVVFHFSRKTIANLKEKANSQCGSNKISSLLALLAHVWRCVTRARKLPSLQETSYSIAVGNRQRLHPSLTENYFGNSMQIKTAKTTVGELMERDLGWAASLLHGVVESHDDTYIRSWLRSWVKNPSLSQFSRWKHCDLVTGSSPRFNVYGNDFGWGKPVAVRSGGAAKIDGKMTVYPGVEEGSIDIEACLSLQTLKALVDDTHFVES